MRILIITQDEPFYLPENIYYLFSKIPKHSVVIGCVVSSVSPFGKKESIFKKALRTYNVFGLLFFLRYSIIYLKFKLGFTKSLKKVLKKFHIPLINLNKNINCQESLDIISSHKPDLLISILGNQIFRQPLIDLAPKGCINLHTALLPKYRGLLPTFWVLKNNEKYTGVSVFFVDKGIDSGPIIVQKKIKITTNVLEKLIKLTKRIGMDAIIESIDIIHSGRVKLIENDASKKTYFTFPQRKDIIEFKNSGKIFY